MAILSNQDDRKDVPEAIAYLAVTAMRQNMPVCVRGGSKVCMAEGYHGFNAGCGVLAWAVHSGRFNQWRLTPALLDVALAGQQPKSQRLFRSLQLKDADQFNSYMDKLEEVRKPVRDVHTAAGALLRPNAILPSHLFIHFCEWATIMEDPHVKDKVKPKLLVTRPDNLMSKLMQCVEILDKEYRLRGAGAGRQGSFSIEVVKHALDVEKPVSTKVRK